MDSNNNGNGGGNGNDNDNSSGRQVMGHQVWGRRQAAEGGGNENKAEMGTMWV